MATAVTCSLAGRRNEPPHPTATEVSKLTLCSLWMLLPGQRFLSTVQVRGGERKLWRELVCFDLFWSLQHGCGQQQPK
ncbi:hypothetical protein AMECASPLE_031087 [Ameca splendens]|uniref:Uncharacterized protein n=1 Tax=Ameca splendens TaxID=208324 RepID=A0ABV0XJC8_9TELE